MSKLEQLIGEWRATMAATPGVAPESLDELEHHVRETVASLLRSGMDEGEAFERALRQLGSAPALAAEFQKLKPAMWLPVKIAVGMGIASAVGMCGFLVTNLHEGRGGWLLTGHVFMVTLGYVTALLGGMLGLCFVGQTCFRTFSGTRRQQVERAAAGFTAVAALLTAVGMILGTFWAKANLGHWWQWEPKETLGLCVLAWLTGSWLVSQLGRGGARGMLILSIAGNVLVLAAWFGPFMATARYWHALGSSFSIILVVMVVHLVFLGAGLASRNGWRRSMV